jgi:hypothetical protein
MTGRESLRGEKLSGQPPSSQHALIARYLFILNELRPNYDADPLVTNNAEVGLSVSKRAQNVLRKVQNVQKRAKLTPPHAPFSQFRSRMDMGVSEEGGKGGKGGASRDASLRETARNAEPAFAKATAGEQSYGGQPSPEPFVP